MKATLLLLFVALVGCERSTAPDKPKPQHDPAPARRTFFISIEIPRLANDDKSYADVKRVLTDLPCFAKATFDSKKKSWINANINRIHGGPMNIQFHFAATPTSDLGEVAKALATLGGDKTKPVMTVSLAAATPIKEEQFASLKNKLSSTNGIDWEHSDRRALALDESGRAKFEQIRAAYKNSGITLADRFTDK